MLGTFLRLVEDKIGAFKRHARDLYWTYKGESKELLGKCEGQNRDILEPSYVMCIFQGHVFEMILIFYTSDALGRWCKM